MKRLEGIPGANGANYKLWIEGLPEETKNQKAVFAAYRILKEGIDPNKALRQLTANSDENGEHFNEAQALFAIAIQDYIQNSEKTWQLGQVG